MEQNGTTVLAEAEDIASARLQHCSYGFIEMLVTGQKRLPITS